MVRGPDAIGIAILMMIQVAAAGDLQAQSVGHDFEDGVKDVLHVWSAPARINSSSAASVLLFAGATGALMAVDEPVYSWLQENPGSLPVKLLSNFGEDSPLNLAGRTAVLFAASSLLYGAGQLFDSRALRDAGIGCASSTVATAVSRTYISRLIGRARPLVGRGAFDFEPLTFDEWERRSFPGGHAAHLMSCVSFWSHRYDLGVAEPALYVLALGVGWARIVDGAHWTSDSFAGQAYGWLIGRAVADRYAERRADHTTPVLVLSWRIPLP